MLIPTATWGAFSAAPTRDRRWYLSIEPNPGTPADDYYIRSHSDIDLSSLPGTVLASKIIAGSTSSQKLNPDEGRATIGSMTISALDISRSLTDQQRSDLLTNNNGLRGKRVRLYTGYAQSSSITDYLLLETQVVDFPIYKIGGVWTIRCRDIQREARKEIFEPIVMNLALPLDATSTTIEMVDIPDAFQTIEHGTSYRDAPGETVAYIKIDDEIIRVPAAGIGTTQFTNVVRGRLRTRAAEHTTDENAGSERGKKVSEVFYLEMPVPKMAHALLTGVLLGQSTTLPSSYHAGIDASDFVRTSEFQNIGLDLYDPTDDTLGTIEEYIIEESFDAKEFIERQLYRKHGLFSPVHADGQLGLKRGQRVLSGSATVGEINDRHIVSKSLSVKFDFSKVINDISIAWNEINGEPSRTLIIKDQSSIDQWGAAPQLEVLAKGLVGSRHSESAVRDFYEGLRDRYSGPPIILSVPVQASQLLYEIGDVVRLRTNKIRDVTNAATSELDRAVEIQGVKRDLMKGKVTYDVFGSTQAAGPLPPLESTAALADSFYTATGTDLSTFPGVVDAGAELVLPDGLTLTGQSTLAAAIYYATKSVRIPSGDTIFFTQNVQLRVRGTFQCDGDLDGSGRGIPGVADTVDVSGIPAFGNITPNVPSPVDFVTQPGVPAFYGSTQGAGGLIERFRRRSGSSSRYRVAIQSLVATITQGEVEAVPAFNLFVPDGGTQIQGLPSDLRGSSGGPGGVRYYNESRDGITDINRGGDGGAGGAGLLIISRGFVFGGSGRVNTSGAGGGAGVRNGSDNHPAWSGSGAGGAPGAALFLLDGATVSSPVLTDGTIVADYGDSPPPDDPFNELPGTWLGSSDTRINDTGAGGAIVQTNRVSSEYSAASGRQAGIAAARIFFLRPYVEPTDDIDDEAILAEQNITLAVVEAFDQRDDPRVTLLQATITEVSTTAAYSHANIYTRLLGTTAWNLQCAAEPSCAFELPADGNTYQVQARPVLINGVEQTDGVIDSALVTDSNQLSAAPNSIATSPLVNGGNIKIQIPNTLGKPDVVRIYRSTTIDDASPSLVATEPTFYVLTADEFCANYQASGITGAQNYYYWAEAENELGPSARFPAGDGVLLTPDDNTGGSPGTPGVNSVGGGFSRVEWIQTLAAFLPTALFQDVPYTFSQAPSASIANGVIRVTRNASGNITAFAQQGSQSGEAHTLGSPVGLGTRTAYVDVTHNASGRTFRIAAAVVIDGADGSDGTDGTDGADGRPGLPGASTLLTYSDLQGGLIGNSVGQYNLVSTAGGNGTAVWALATSSDVAEIRIASTGGSPLTTQPDNSAFLSQVVVNDQITWYETAGRWIDYRVSSVSLVSGVYIFGVEYVEHDETDGNGNISASAEYPITFRFSRALPGIDGATLVNSLAYGWGTLDPIVGTDPSDSLSPSTSVIENAGNGYIGGACVLITGGTSGGGFYTGDGNVAMPTRITPQRRWILLAWVNSPDGTVIVRGQLQLGTNEGGSTPTFLTTSAPVGVSVGASWVRVAFEIDGSAASEALSYARARFFSSDLPDGDVLRVDGMMLVDVTDFPWITAATADTYIPAYIPIAEGGPPGGDGIDGIDGEDGVDGEDGAPGADGAPGIGSPPDTAIIWGTSNSGTTWNPSSLTQDSPVREFIQGASTWSFQVRATRTAGASGVVTLSTLSLQSGLTISYSGQGTDLAIATITHTATGAQSFVRAAAVNIVIDVGGK